VTTEHPAVGPMQTVGLPGRFSAGTRETGRPPPPIPGEHTAEVLAELGFAETEIRDLFEDRVVRGQPTERRP